MKYNEDEYLMLSGIQHYYFCKRQWSLIHVEQQWEDNKWTAEGQLVHKNTDNPYLKESRGNRFISRAIPISSPSLGLAGILDVVEFVQRKQGITIPGKSGLWWPEIIEFKRGKEKKDNRDIVQLAAQVICLEEKFNITIDYAFLYYKQNNKKLKVYISNEIRSEVKLISDIMHESFKNKVTLPAETYKNCKECSLYDICMPRLTKKPTSISNYMNNHLDEDLV